MLFKETSAYTVVFPQLMRRLDYPSLLDVTDYEAVSVDGLELLRWYCKEMTMGMAYERYVQSEKNRSQPNRLTRMNFTNTRQVHSQGWRWEWVESLIDREWPQLTRIPADADMLATSECDRDAIDFLLNLTQCKGISISNATKLAYQKRPSLFPIFDTLVRQAMNIYYVEGDDPPANQKAFELGFAKFREVAKHDPVLFTAPERNN